MSRPNRRSRRSSGPARQPEQAGGTGSTAQTDPFERGPKRRRISTGSDVSMEDWMASVPEPVAAVARPAKQGREADSVSSKRARRASHVRDNSPEQLQWPPRQDDTQQDEPFDLTSPRKRRAAGPRLSSESINRPIARDHKRHKTHSLNRAAQGKRAIDAVDAASDTSDSEAPNPPRTRNADSDVEEEEEEGEEQREDMPPARHARQASSGGGGEHKRGRIQRRKRGSDDEEMMNGTLSDALDPIVDRAPAPTAATGRGSGRRRLGRHLITSPPSSITRLLKQRKEALFAMNHS